MTASVWWTYTKDYYNKRQEGKHKSQTPGPLLKSSAKFHFEPGIQKGQLQRDNP